MYALASLFIAFSNDFTVLLAGRFGQGVGATAPRIIAVAMICDTFGERRMAKVISFITVVFLLVLMFTPGIGSAILALGKESFGFCS